MGNNIVDKLYCNKTIKELKKDAAELATAFGYNIHSLNLDVINVQDFYCRGFAKASLEYDKLKEQNDSLLEALKEAKYELMNSISNTCKTEKEAIIKLKENSTYQKVKAAIQKAEQ